MKKLKVMKNTKRNKKISQEYDAKEKRKRIWKK